MNGTVGSLFSGIGGIELGFEWEGFTTLWHVENDPHAQAVLRKKFPKTTIYGDITTLDFTTVPQVDILVGGFPCQDISNAGKRVGITGSRSSLWKYFCEAIRIIRPRYALIENVAALARRGLNVVLRDLAEIGYDAEWYNLSASAVGAPHRRERIFIICYPQHVGCTSTEESRGIKEGSNSDETESQQACQLTGSSKQLPELADPDSSRHIHGQTQEQSAETWKQAQLGSEPSCANVSDSDSERCQFSRSRTRPQERDFEGICSQQEIISSRSKQNWATEPELGRVAHGIPNRVDRIKRLGNAVVPQCSQIFAQAIKTREERLNG